MGSGQRRWRGSSKCHQRRMHRTGTVAWARFCRHAELRTCHTVGPRCGKCLFTTGPTRSRPWPSTCWIKGNASTPVSAKTGATRADSWVDIEGGIGTVFAYSGIARRELPNETFAVEGNVDRAIGSRWQFRGPAYPDRLNAVSPCISTPSISPAGACSRKSPRA